MKPYFLLAGILCLAGCANKAAPLTAEGPSAAVTTMYQTVLTATIGNDYDSFMSVCDARMKAALTKPVLKGAGDQLDPRMKKGEYESVYLGPYTQHGYRVHLWKIVFPGDGDDVLAMLSVKDGKCGGFFLK